MPSKIGKMLDKKALDIAKRQDEERDKMIAELHGSTLNRVGNEVTLLLMDQNMTDDQKSMAAEVLDTVNVAKETIEQSKDDTQQDKVDVDNGQLLNDEMAMEDTEPVTTPPTIQQLGEQQAVNHDAIQPTFDVQQVPQVQQVQQVPQAPELVPTKRRGKIFMFIKNVMSVITSCLMVRPVARWRNDARAKDALAKARQKAVLLGEQVDVPEGEQKQETPPNGNKLDFKTNFDKVPVIWERPQGYSDAEQAPVLEAHAAQKEAGSTNELNNGGTHSFIVLRYSKEDYRTGKMRRYRLAFGFYPRFAADMSGVAYRAVVPGILNDDAAHASTSGRSYQITNDQVNDILSQAPKEAEKGYNMITHNCTNFVVDMLQAVGVADPGIQETKMDLGNLEVATPLVKVIMGGALKNMRSNLLRRMDNNDFSYQRLGKKLVSYEELQRFEQSIQYDDVDMFGYGPGMLGEQLRVLNTREGNAEAVVSAQVFDEFSKPKERQAKRELVDKYLAGDDKDTVAGVKENILAPMEHMIEGIQGLFVPLKPDTSEDNKKWNAMVTEDRKKYLNDTDAFEQAKQGLEAATRQWLGTLDPVAHKQLNLLGYKLLGEIAEMERQFYKEHETHIHTVFETGEIGTTDNAILTAYNIFGKKRDGDPLFQQCFAKVYGNRTYQNVMDTMKVTADVMGLWKSDALKRDQQMINKRNETLANLYAVELKKLQLLVRKTDLSQEQVNAAFGGWQHEEKNAKSQEWNPPKKKNEDEVQSVYSLIILSKVLPTAKDTLNGVIAGCRLITTPQQNEQSLAFADQCKICHSMIQLVQDGITNHGDGLLKQIVQAIAYNGGVPLSAEEVVKVLLNTIFNGFFSRMTQGTLFAKELLNGMEEFSQFPKTNSAAESVLSLPAKQAEMVAQINALVARVLTSGKVVTV